MVPGQMLRVARRCFLTRFGMIVEHSRTTMDGKARGNLAEVRFLQDGVYGMRRRVDGKRITIPLDPQPTDVVCVCIHCTQSWHMTVLTGSVLRMLME